MKKLFLYIGFLSFSGLAFGQVAVGKSSITNNSVLLEFDDSASNAKGIILPSVSTVPSIPVNGTFIFNTNTKKIEVYQNGNWMALTDAGNITGLYPNNSAEVASAGVIIGNKDTAPKGALVLESNNKALILPKIGNPHTTVGSPYPGMICYDTVSNSLAVFDGSVWSYWK